MALNPDAPEVIEVEILRSALQRMSCARVDADARAQSKERELQIVKKHLHEMEELLKRSEECQKKLEKEIRRTLEILEIANRPPAEVIQGLKMNVENERKLGRTSRKLRKPHTPFLLWCKDKRQEVCDAHPTASTADLYAIMLKLWDSISVEDKDHYMELHSEAFKKYLLKVASQSKSSETDQVPTTLSEEDNIKQKAMSLLGQYLASKKAQITQPGIEVDSDTGMSNSSTIAEASAAMVQERSSIHALPSRVSNSSTQITHSLEELPEAAELKTSLRTVRNNLNEVNDDEQKSTRQELLENQLDKAKQNPSAYLLFSMEQRKALPLNEPGMTHCQMNASIAKLWRELPPEEKTRWNELAIAVQKTENADEQIPLCIPPGLVLEKCLEESENGNIDQNPKLPSWIYDKRIFQKAEDDRKNGIREQVSDHRIWEHLRSLPVNTFTHH